MTPSDLLAYWDGPTDLAADIRQPYDRVKKWFARGRIPSAHVEAVIAAARKKGHKVSAETALKMLSNAA